MSKFFSEKVYIIPGAKHPFHNKKDAAYYCTENGVDPKLVEVYDSNKEYKRYCVLRELEKQGKITNLRRQVRYLIIPANNEYHTEVKQVKSYDVYSDTNQTDKSIGITFQSFQKKKDAIEFCHNEHIPLKNINTEIEDKIVVVATLIESAAYYTADYVYNEVLDNGLPSKDIVEDVKSDYTRKQEAYVLRRKLMASIGIRIKET